MKQAMKAALRYGSNESVGLQVMWCRLSLLEMEQFAVMFTARQPLIQGPTGYNQTKEQLVRTAREINRSIRVLRRRVAQREMWLLQCSTK